MIKGYLVTLLLLSLLLVTAAGGFVIPNEWSSIMQYAFFASLVLWLIIAIMLKAILQALPTTIQLRTTARNQVNPEVFRLEKELHSLGFQTISKPMLVGLHPPANMVALRHPTGSCYATIYHSLAAPGKVGVDFVSVLEGRDAQKTPLLTTGNLIEGGCMPLPPENFMQLFPGESTDQLLSQHNQALKKLQGRRVNFVPATRERFADVFRGGIARYRGYFLTNPVWHTLVAVFRTITKSTPARGSIRV